MDLPIFFVDELIGGTITLSEETSRHVVQVLRMMKGEKIQLTNGKGALCTAEIVDPHKKKTSVNVTTKILIPKKDKKVCIAISLIKNNNRFEWFLEKATEIGVTEIYPLLCERTEKQHFRFERMNQILVAAMLQSRQVWLPTLHHPAAIIKVIENSSFQTKLIAHCEEDTKKSIGDFFNQTSVQILIGPEGDFSKEEIVLALNCNFQAVSLGENRLRTETAGVVAATVLMQ